MNEEGQTNDMFPGVSPTAPDLNEWEARKTGEHSKRFVITNML